MDIGKYRERIKELQDYLLINNSTGYYPNICNELMEELNIVLNELEKKEAVINEMAEMINNHDIEEDVCKQMGKNRHCNDFIVFERNCIKEYFTKKVEGK